MNVHFFLEAVCMENEMVDFYKERGISPVKQNIEDLQLHYARRRNCIGNAEFRSEHSEMPTF